MTDPWAQRPPDVPALLCADPERWNQLEGRAGRCQFAGMADRADPRQRGRSTRLLALGNTRLEKRLPLIEAPTLLIWGEGDRIVPRSYAGRFAAAIAGRTETTVIPEPATWPSSTNRTRSPRRS